MKEKHLIVVSVDALVFEDLEYAKTLPAFGRLMREGSRIERIRTIYPSLTHPVHATMMSGNPAGVTGVVLAEGSILNHAPTFAKVLGVSLPDVQGKPVDGLLNV